MEPELYQIYTTHNIGVDLKTGSDLFPFLLMITDPKSGITNYYQRKRKRSDSVL